MEPLTVFAECDTSIVSDAMDAHGLDGVMEDSRLKPRPSGRGYSRQFLH